jgi:tetratricopeptide (TPR) repeat protein
MRTLDDNPYPGSRSFQQADIALFHGRDADAQAVVDFWMSNRLAIVTGPVASGKTSLLHAGVYPLLQGGQANALPVGRLSHGMTFPFAATPGHNPYTYALLSTWQVAGVATRLAGQTVTGFLRQLARRSGAVIYAAIDQAEDISVDGTGGLRQTWRRQFLADLAEACETIPQLHLLLVARTAALNTIQARLGAGAMYEVKPLSVQNAEKAVTGPAAGAGRRFASGAARRLVADLCTSGIASAHGEQSVQADVVEPALLQAVCHHLWHALPAGLSEITEWHVREFGDVDSALAGFCGQVITDVAAEHDLKAQRLHSWLLRTFVTDGGTRGTAYEGMTDTADMPNAVVRSLVDRHLLTHEWRASARWCQLLSDRLIEPLRHADIRRAAPPTACDYLRAAKRQLALGELGLARKHAKASLLARHAPGLRGRADAEVLLGNVAHEQDDPDEALPHYRHAASLLEAADDSRAAVLCLAATGQTLLELGHIRDAVTEFRAAVERAPSELALQTQLARSLWHLGEGEAAIAILNGSLGIDGGHQGALRARGEILADLGDARNAVLDLERASVRDQPSARAAHGLALAVLGDHSGANREIQASVNAAPHNGRVLLYAARASALAGDKVSSWELARRAIDATDPELSPAHRSLALKLARDK